MNTVELRDGGRSGRTTVFARPRTVVLRYTCATTATTATNAATPPTANRIVPLLVPDADDSAGVTTPLLPVCGSESCAPLPVLRVAESPDRVDVPFTRSLLDAGMGMPDGVGDADAAGVADGVGVGVGVREGVGVRVADAAWACLGVPVGVGVGVAVPDGVDVGDADELGDEQNSWNSVHSAHSVMPWPPRSGPSSSPFWSHSASVWIHAGAAAVAWWFADVQKNLLAFLPVNRLGEPRKWVSMNEMSGVLPEHGQPQLDSDASVFSVGFRSLPPAAYVQMWLRAPWFSRMLLGVVVIEMPST